jgi:ABC-type transport system involved in multi-copper enzyme maturation permease subunit
MLPGIWAVFCFEWRRACTFPRLAWWLLLVLFPLGIAVTLRVNSRTTINADLWTAILFGLVPGVVSMMGVFLWATPAVQAEVEAKSWNYLGVRPHGGVALLLGKYLQAVTWTIPAALLGMTLAVLVAWPENLGQMWRTLSALIPLSCLSYAAIYLFIGVLCRRRAMVIAVGYTLVFEILFTWVPAVVNHWTVQFRLRSLLAHWMQWQSRNWRGPDFLFSTAPPALHVAALLLITFGGLAAAIFVLRHQQIEASDEG